MCGNWILSNADNLRLLSISEQNLLACPTLYKGRIFRYPIGAVSCLPLLWITQTSEPVWPTLGIHNRPCNHWVAAREGVL